MKAKGVQVPDLLRRLFATVISRLPGKPWAASNTVDAS